MSNQNQSTQTAGGAERVTAVELVPLPYDRIAPQLTARAIATGMLLGGALSLCNVYGGLKIGWSFNMSITAALLGFGFWKGWERLGRGREFGMLENNINQTAASAGASISSAGLVAPIPALTMITGLILPWHLLALWTFSVCLVGITVAIALRRQMILVDKLTFPSGVASAMTLREIYSKGAEAMARVKALLAGAVTAAGLKLVETLAALPKVGLPGALAVQPGGLLEKAGLARVTPYNLTFALEPSLLMVGIGGIIGTRAAVSLLLGAVVAWLMVGPWVLELGWAEPGAPAASWYGTMLKWLLWPGVSMMVTSSLTSFAFSWRSIARSLGFGRKDVAQAGVVEDASDEVSRKWFLWGLGSAFVLSVVCQVTLFDIQAHIAALGVMLTFLLAVVAGRVTGETSITPVGAMGKVTQLMFGVLAPGQPAANLMAANVTGGAASQCGDLLHDLKTGYLLGASARLQAMAQVLGALAGALVGTAAYLVLIPDPKRQLLTDEWPAPSVAAWKAVAEIFMKGFEAMPAGTVGAIVVAGLAGIVLAVLEKVLPSRQVRFVPSPASLGLAFVIPAYNSLSMFLGGMVALALTRWLPSWSGRFVVVIASGMIAGESLMGVGLALKQMLG